MHESDFAEQLVESQNKIEETNQERSFLLPAILLLLVGGLIGYFIGQGSAGTAQSEISANAAVATAPVVQPLFNQTATAVPITPIVNNIGDDSAASFIPAGLTPVSILPETLRTMGNPDAPVTLVEFSDYQCPFCRRHFLQTFPQLKTQFIDTGRVYYVFKDFPIASLHPFAYRMHEAALCAADEGGSEVYWQIHDYFFANAEAFQVDSLEGMDAAILSQFETAGFPDVTDCLANNDKADIVQAGIAEGLSLGVNGTPAFFINGFPVQGAQPYDLFQYAIDLAEKGQLATAYSRTGPNDGKAQATAAALAAQPADVPLDDAPTKGNPNAPVTIVEYSDFQCPFCYRHFTTTLPQLQAYIDNGTVRYVFKDFPLHSIHPQAQKAHEAARCARELGGDEAYWALHNLLFTNQGQWANNPDHVTVLQSLATQAGLPQTEFNDCLDSGRYVAVVNADVAEGVQLGISGTPTFFINGQRIVGAQPFDVFQQLIEAFLVTE